MTSKPDTSPHDASKHPASGARIPKDATPPPPASKPAETAQTAGSAGHSDADHKKHGGHC